MTLTPLQPGNCLALVAPASPFSEEKFDRACSILQDAGFNIWLGPHLLARRGYLAGTEAERAGDLTAALCDPAVAAVICVRGGYGSGRLLPWLAFPTLKKHPKIFLGFSDITFLHLAFAGQLDWVTFHGPNLMQMMNFYDGDNPERFRHVLATLQGATEFSWPLAEQQILKPGVATGKLLGGNLTCLTHLVGTRYFPSLDGALLLVEDCGEALYRLDRLFAHLKLSGMLERLGGLALGYFKDCGEIPRIHQMILEQVAEFHFPVIADLPFGHGAENEVIPMGTPFYLNTYEHTFRAIEDPFAA